MRGLAKHAIDRGDCVTDKADVLVTALRSQEGVDPEKRFLSDCKQTVPTVTKDKKCWLPIGDLEQFGFKLDRRSDYFLPRPVTNVDRANVNGEMLEWAHVDSNLTNTIDGTL